MERIRLRYIQFETDFRRSAETIFQELPRNTRALLEGPNDALCVVSSLRTTIIFIWRPANITGIKGDELQVIRSTRFRLPGHNRWNPLMLANYAKHVGLELIGLRTFEEHYKELSAAS